MTTPGLVSIVIPCYNQGHFLGDAIESVLAQTYQNFEITVVDDGSPDNTTNVAAKYPKVNCVRQENGGPSAARNTGLRLSKGEYLVFLDADDRLLPCALETGVRHLAARTGCAFVAGRHSYINGAGGPMPILQEQRLVEADHYLELLRANYIGCPATVMYRRQMLDAVGGFNLAFTGVEDYDMYLRLSKDFPIHCYSEIIAEYRIHDANMSANLKRMRGGVLDLLRSELERIRGDARREDACREGIRFQENKYDREELVARTRMHTRQGRWALAVWDALTLLRRHPQAFAIHARRKVGL